MNDYGMQLPTVMKVHGTFHLDILGHQIHANYKFWGIGKEEDDKSKGTIISHIEFFDSPVVSSTSYKSHFFQPDLLYAYQTPEEAIIDLASSFMREMDTYFPKQSEQLSLF